MKRSLNEIKLRNLLSERNLALAKRSANTRANLPTDRIDERIAVLNAAIERQHEFIVQDGLKEKM